MTVFIWLVIDSKCHIRYHFLSSNKDVQELTVKLTSTIFWNKHNKRNVTEYTFEQVRNIRNKAKQIAIIDRGSYMSAHVLLIFSLFRNKFNNFNNTRA